MSHTLDCRGLACPEPVIRCRALLRDSSPASLVALVDNAAALENVGRFLNRNGYATKTEQVSGDEWRINATRIGDNPTAPAETAPKEPVAPDGGKILVFLTTETLGRGDDDLGAKLMNAFLANLPEFGPGLWRVILLNGAVKLSAKEGEALNTLRALEAAGVSVLVCGTCLGHYGLLDKKLVGETTNMMDVVSSLALAQKIIRP